MIDWKVLDRIEQVHDIKAASEHRPQLLFKHSTTCPVSGIAKRRLKEDWKWDNIDAHYLDLLRYREVSNHIADFYQVYHESPQIILVHKGEVIHDTSHLDISIKDIEEVLQYSGIA